MGDVSCDSRSRQVLHEVAEKGFEQEQLMAIMHQVFISALSLVIRAAALSLSEFRHQVELDGLAVSADRGLRLALDVSALSCSARASVCWPDCCVGRYCRGGCEEATPLSLCIPSGI